MGKASPIQTAFNSGELSPELEGRVDLAKYGAGCFRLENFIPLVQGPVRRRGGTEFVRVVKDSSKRTWLATFEFSTADAYVLEFGNLYVRFYTDNGILESSPGVPGEVVTPWTTANFVNADGGFALQIVQSGDILYICHPSYAPRKLSRTGVTTWSLTTFSADGGPFDDYDPDQTTTMYASARTGSVTVTASASAFASTDVGRLIYLENKKANSVGKWEVAKVVPLNDLRRAGGRTYKCTDAGTTGTITPTHTKGAEYDGSDPATACQWEFQDPGYGWGTITAYTSATEVTAAVSDAFPDQVVTAGNATTRWAFGSWGSVPGFPSHCAFFRNRLLFARASDRKIWFSTAADYENFRDRDDAGLVVADMGITITVEADQSANGIQYLVAGDELIIGTSGGEYVCREMTDSEPFGPANVRITNASTYGTRGVQPVQVGGSILFVQRSGRRLREISYDALNDGYKTLDMSILATHMVPKEHSIVQMAYQKEPHSIIWCVRDDGKLLAMTFDREQYAEAHFGGWHRHPIGGNGIVESVACIPSPKNDRDDLWLIVRRTINGATVRYVERMHPEHETGESHVRTLYSDCGLMYWGPPATTISGLSHLEGETVDVLADGCVRPSCVVIGGAITLTTPASIVSVGMSAPAKLATMRIEAGAQDGTAQSKLKRSGRVTVRLLETLGGRIGPSQSLTDEILYRSSATPMDTMLDPFTGDKEVLMPGGYEHAGRTWMIFNQPLPATVIAIMPQLVVSDR